MSVSLQFGWLSFFFFLSRVRNRVVLEYVDQYNLISFYDQESSEITIKVN